MSTWSHLPNAHRVDWVIESVKQNPQLWREAWLQSRTTVRARNSAWIVAGAARRRAIWNAARNEIWDEIWDAADGAELDMMRDAAPAADAAWAAVLALVAYDDCDQYLKMGYEKLQVYATLSEKPQAILLLPMVRVREKLYQNALKYNCII